MHAYWDDLLIVGNEPGTTATEVRDMPKDIATKYPRSRLPQLASNVTLEQWTRNETYPLAVHVAYLDGQLPVPEQGRRTVLSSAYQQKAHEVAEQQVALAGYRLADFLVKLF